MILKDALITFASTLNEIDDLNSWRLGTYLPLELEPINVYQAFSVVKLLYISARYDSVQRLAAYTAEATNYPGSTAILTKNTVDALDIENINNFETVYQIFRDSEESLPIKASWAQGWNSGVHLTWLRDTYKSKYFEDILTLSTILSAEHFKAFYNYLSPIDSDYDGNVLLFNGVELKGVQMLGHLHNIRKMVEGIKLKQKLLAYNP